MSEEPNPTRTVLQRIEEGDAAAPAELYELVEGELRRLAGALMRSQGEGHTLQPTALVHEAWMKLTAGEGGSWRDHGHFVATAATAMRHILVDHAREKASAKRGGTREREPLDSVDPTADDTAEQLVALDDAMARIADEDERARQVAEMRLFAGLSAEEIAAALEVSPRTVDRAWRTARDVLRAELGDERVG